MNKFFLVFISLLFIRSFSISQIIEDLYWNLQQPYPWNSSIVDVKFAKDYTHFTSGEVNSLILFSSPDNCETWYSSRPLPNLTNYRIEVTDSKVWVSGVKSITLNGTTTVRGYLLFSNDNGLNWQLQNTFDSLDIRYLRFFDNKNAVLLGFKSVLVSGKSTPQYFIYHTSDEGKTWREIKVDYSYFQGGYFFIDHNHAWVNTYFAYDSRILSTTDGGITWTERVKTSDMINFVSFPDTNNGWYMETTNNYPSGTKIFSTKNSGKDWVEQFSLEKSRPMYFVVLDTLNIWALISFNAPNNVTEIRLYYTSNGGKNWQLISSPQYENGYQAQIYFKSKTEGLITANQAEIYKTTDGGITWIKKHKSITSQYLWGVDFTDNNTGWAVGGRGPKKPEGVIIKTTNSGRNWDIIFRDSLLAFSRVDFFDQNNGFVIGYKASFPYNNGVIFNTYDGGTNWNRTNYDSLVFKDIFMVNSKSGWAVGAKAKGDLSDIMNYNNNLISSVILYTSDGGKNWIQKYSDAQNKCTLSAVYFTDEKNGFAVGDYFTILKTTDGGISWNQSNGNLDHNTLISKINLSGLYFSNKNTGWIVGTYNTSRSPGGIILKTKDGGINWDTVTTKYTLTKIAFCDSMNAWILAGPGIYYTSDKCKSLNYSTYFPGGYDIKFISSDLGWVVGPMGAIYKYSPVLFRPSGVIPPTQEINYHLIQNYPNPFNPSTTIQFNLDRANYVSLKIYNMLGQEIETLLGKKLDAGLYKIIWEPKFFPSGVYFYRLNTNNMNEIRKMVFLK